MLTVTTWARKTFARTEGKPGLIETVADQGYIFNGDIVNGGFLTPYACDVVPSLLILLALLTKYVPL